MSNKNKERFFSVKLLFCFVVVFTNISLAQTKRAGKLLSDNRGAFRDIVIEKNLHLLNKNPKNLYALLELGQLFSQKNRHKEAVKYYKKALGISKKSITAIRGIAHSYHRQKKNKKAEFYYRKSLEFDKSDDVALYNLGTLFFDQKKINKAKMYFRQSVKHNPKNGSSIFALGEIYKNNNDCASAIKEYSKVLKMNKRALLAYFRVGQCQMELARKKKALAYFMEFIDKAEDFEPAVWKNQILMAKKYVNELHSDLSAK